MLKKMDHEETIEDYSQLEQALSIATQTKNEWSRRRGFPPEVLVFGKLRKYPGSNTSDNEVTSHLLALEGTAEGIRFQKELALRERESQESIQCS